jgi:soluble lytic murein transglycosylase-like protein
VDAPIPLTSLAELEIAFARSRRAAAARRAVAARRAALAQCARRTSVALLIAVVVALLVGTGSIATAPVSSATSQRHLRLAAGCAVAGPFVSAFRTASRETGLSVPLLAAVAWQESRMERNAVSPAGARGLLQLMPGTARIVGVRAGGPRANIIAGARYLRRMLDRFGGDLELALSAYNAGPTAVDEAGVAAPTIETLRYAKNVELDAAALADCA